MDDHNSMENGQPDADGTRMERHDSLSSNNSGNLSPVPFTSFHGLNMIADAMGQGEGETNTLELVSGYVVVAFFYQCLVC